MSDEDKQLQERGSWLESYDVHKVRTAYGAVKYSVVVEDTDERVWLHHFSDNPEARLNYEQQRIADWRRRVLLA